MTMKREAILLEDVEHLLLYQRLRLKFQILGTTLMERQHQNLHDIEKLKVIAKDMHQLRQRHRFSEDADLAAEIRKYAAK